MNNITTVIIITMQPKKFVDLVYKALGTSLSVIYLIELVVYISITTLLLNFSYQYIIKNDTSSIFLFWSTIIGSIIFYYIDTKIYQSTYDKIIKAFPEFTNMNENELIEEINYMDDNEVKVLKEIMYGMYVNEKDIRYVVIVE